MTLFTSNTSVKDCILSLAVDVWIKQSCFIYVALYFTIDGMRITNKPGTPFTNRV